MINISSIKLNMYCPMKLYIQTHVDKNENEEHEKAIEIKKLKVNIQDLIQKNIRQVKKEMNITEIETILSNNIDSYIESASNSIGLDINSDEINEITENTYFNIKIIALKIKQSMILLDKDGNSIADIFFPNSIYHYHMSDLKAELNGVCDKIEIINGKYYPISIKSSNPPIKGVWSQDAIELVANALLIEEEFNTEVYVGFVYYEKIGEKRPVVMDVKLRKELFDMINKVKEIIDNKKIPKVEKSNKCNKCQYKNICIKD